MHLVNATNQNLSQIISQIHNNHQIPNEYLKSSYSREVGICNLRKGRETITLAFSHPKQEGLDQKGTTFSESYVKRLTSHRVTSSFWSVAFWMILKHFELLFPVAAKHYI